jgi:hypothetical protein
LVAFIEYKVEKDRRNRQVSVVGSTLSGSTFSYGKAIHQLHYGKGKK